MGFSQTGKEKVALKLSQGPLVPNIPRAEASQREVKWNFLLWMDEILHHQRNPGMMIPHVNANKQLLSMVS